MGQTLACCGKSDIDNNDVKTQQIQENTLEKLSSPQATNAIVKIQSIFRGYSARQHYQKLRNEYAMAAPPEGYQVEQ